MARHPVDLDVISEEALLNTRLCDLPLRIEGTWLEPCVQVLYDNLEKKGIGFKPPCYLADEWLTPDKEPVVGVAFFLAHPALMKLENKMMLEVEGGTQEWCLKLLRHETGHALNYAYQLYKRRKWRETFGRFTKAYEESYRFRPYSKNYVRHLEYYYAQYHPDEDFAETFAVWLTPDMDWARQYQGWKALNKLRFVDQLMAEVGRKPPLVPRGKRYWEAARIKKTLGNYYKAKRRLYAEDFLDFHDANLRRIFSAPLPDDAGRGQAGAAQVLKKYRKEILESVSRWTGEKRFVVHDILKDVMARCRDLRLVTHEDEPATVLRIAAYVTTLVMNYLYTGRMRGGK